MADFDKEMAKFYNPNKYSKPSQEQTKLNIEEYKSRYEETKKIKAQIRELEKKKETLEKETDAFKKAILVYDVQIRYIDAYHLFTLLEEAAEFKGDLVMYGIKESDVKITLTNDFDELEYIDMHTNKEHAHYYDVEKIFKEYRTAKKRADTNWLDNNN